ncbi:MAG: maltooligosyltrehalose trehalohydrolase [Actinomycetota bacterium]
MTTPAVWAPAASSVELVTDEGRAPMNRDGEWWRAGSDVPAGTRYAFAVDGSDAMPDPRSASQPEGVHGRSVTVDHADYPWRHSEFTGPALADSVLYELHVGTFSAEGTFAGAARHLDALVDLGVTTVELMPVAEFPGSRGWGYDGVDLFAPHHGYGGPEELKALVDACHARGLSVVLDVVYNHLGPDGNYLGAFGPYFTDRFNTPWGAAVNLDDRGSDDVRAFIVDNALMWLRDYRFDGLRLDAVHALLDQSATHILEDMAIAVDQFESNKFLIAESDLNDPRLVRRRDVGGYGVHAQWCDDFHHALHAMVTGERDGYYADFGRIEDLAEALRYGFVFRGQHSPFRGRRHGRPPEGVSLTQMIGYSQNHDQIGNRAAGDRLGRLASDGGVRIAAALVLLGPLTPMLFQGEEWGASTPFQYFTDHENPELGRAVSEGRKREFAAFGWSPDDVPDPQAQSTFDASRLHWDEREKPNHAGLLAFYKDLIALRRSRPELRNGAAEVSVEGDARLVMRRGDVVVTADFAADTVAIDA